MSIKTRLTERFGLAHPIVLAPMALAGGGALAAAVSGAGGLGLIGGGYGDRDWLEEQFRKAGNARIGCGFITWHVAATPELVDLALAHNPAALFLSFGDPSVFAEAARAAGVPVIMQVQTIRDAGQALDLGADVIVAQGAAAGGHGETRATITLVPEVADLIAARSPDTLLCAAGGIGDGRGLAAALMLGADGVVMGTRFWAAAEALVHPNQHAAAVSATGDETVRQSVTDITRGFDWPERFNIRVVRNDYVDRWIGHEDRLRQEAETEMARFAAAAEQGDASVVPAIAGEAVGLIRDIRPAAEILEEIATEAEGLLSRAAQRVSA